MDVHKYLSKKLYESDYNDMLLNDWGIYHFHLGIPGAGEKFAPRTGKLLFTLISKEDFYCITIGNHGDWNPQNLLEIVHKNWQTFLSLINYMMS